MIRVEVLGQEHERIWDEYLKAHPNSTCYHALPWKVAAEKAYNLATHYLVAFEGGSARGILPLFGVRGLLKSHYTNGLFGGSASILADSLEVKNLLLKKAFECVASHGYRHLVFKTMDKEHIPEMTARFDSWVVAEIALDPDPEKLWNGLKRKTKYCIGRAEREGLKVHWGPQHLREFYDVLSENLHSKGSPVYGLSFLRELLMGFGENANVIILKHSGRAVAGAITLTHKNTISVPFGSSRPKCKHLRPSNLLIWEIIKYGALRGMNTLDLGRSLKGSGALNFKLGFGATVRSHSAQVFSKKGNHLNLDPVDVGWFVNNWKYIPRTITDRVGPLICKQIAGLL